MHKKFRFMMIGIILSFLLTISGVYATWMFCEGTPVSQFDSFNVLLNEITFAPKETLHITAVSLMSDNNVSNVEVGFTHPTYISSKVNAQRSGGTITYKVTVYNNTSVTYWYFSKGSQVLV